MSCYGEFHVVFYEIRVTVSFNAVYICDVLLLYDENLDLFQIILFCS